MPKKGNHFSFPGLTHNPCNSSASKSWGHYFMFLDFLYTCLLSFLSKVQSMNIVAILNSSMSDISTLRSSEIKRNIISWKNEEINKKSSLIYKNLSPHLNPNLGHLWSNFISWIIKARCIWKNYLYVFQNQSLKSFLTESNYTKV